MLPKKKSNDSMIFNTSINDINEKINELDEDESFHNYTSVSTEGEYYDDDGNLLSQKPVEEDDIVEHIIGYNINDKPEFTDENILAFLTRKSFIANKDDKSVFNEHYYYKENEKNKLGKRKIEFKKDFKLKEKVNLDTDSETFERDFYFKIKAKYFNILDNIKYREDAELELVNLIKDYYNLYILYKKYKEMYENNIIEKKDSKFKIKELDDQSKKQMGILPFRLAHPDEFRKKGEMINELD